MGKGTLAAAFSLSIIATLVTVDAQVGTRRLTVDDIYSPGRRINFSGSPDTGISWLDSSTYLSRRRGTNGVEWIKVDAASGRTSPLFDAAAMETALAGNFSEWPLRRLSTPATSHSHLGERFYPSF